MRIAKLVQSEGWFDIALDFIRCALSIDEAVYAVYLKMAHDSGEKAEDVTIAFKFRSSLRVRRSVFARDGCVNLAVCSNG
uniref:Pentatricopeptide repeat-containing protein n=1 Tax=Ascaris lumbricoides TaxID=6252 RepID=A0A0M3IQ03_ASCLU